MPNLVQLIKTVLTLKPVLFFNKLFRTELLNNQPLNNGIMVLKTLNVNNFFAAKRTDEQIFFGNQQNAPRVKKADPETDSRGLVRALPADEIRDVTNEETSDSEKPQSSEVQETPKDETIPSENSDSQDESVSSEKQDQEVVDKNTEIPDEEVMKDQLLKAETADEAENGENMAEEGSGSVSEPASGEMSYDYLQKLYSKYNCMSNRSFTVSTI